MSSPEMNAYKVIVWGEKNKTFFRYYSSGVKQSQKLSKPNLFSQDFLDRVSSNWIDGDLVTQAKDPPTVIRF